MTDPTTGVLLVDHGSRRPAANRLLHDVAALLDHPIVEPAHMELAEPTIETAFARLVARGARRVLVCPFFLSPGRHWQEDIPAQAARAAAGHAGVDFLVTAPIGAHPLVARILESRIEHCLAHATAGGPPCDVCAGTAGCAVSRAPADDGG